MGSVNRNDLWLSGSVQSPKDAMGIAIDRKARRSLGAISILLLISIKTDVPRAAMAGHTRNPCQHRTGQDAASPQSSEEFYQRVAAGPGDADHARMLLSLCSAA